MNQNRTFTKKEISNILSKASKIQARNDLLDDEPGLTEAELIHIAGEAGIDKDSIKEAIQSADIPDIDSEFNWFTASSKVQDLQFINGEINEETWEDVIQDLRKISKQVGRVSQVGHSFEWELKQDEVGFKHISLTPKNGKTRIQLVSNWFSLKIIATLIPFILGIAFSGILLDGTNLPDFAYLILPFLGGLSGLGLGRFYLKSYYEKQKSQFKQIIRSIHQHLNPSDTPAITIEEREAQNQSSVSGKARRERS